MILETREIKHYHANGQLKYSTTLAVIAPMFEPAYENVLRNDNGELLVRQGVTECYHDNGQLHWLLEYNQDGSLKKTDHPKYRKDGTIIVH